MIYMLKVSNMIAFDQFVFQSEADDPGKLYREFLEIEAQQRGIEINSHWHNMMNREDYHPDLSTGEYRKKEKEWKKFLRSHSLLWFFREELKAKELESKTLYV